MSISAIEQAQKKVYWAIASMARSELPRRDRLAVAARSHLDPVFALLNDPAELSPEVGLKIATLLQRLTSHGSYRETIFAMREGEVDYVIWELLNLHTMLVQAMQLQRGEPEPELEGD